MKILSLHPACKYACILLAAHVLCAADLRPPAVPLVTHDPYFSIWSTADHLTDQPTKHWTGTVQSLCSLVRIDGKPYRLLGNAPKQVPALPQTGIQVLPTHTIYQFAGANVQLTLTFLTPALPSDLDVLSRPVTYLTWTVRSTDAGAHKVQVYFDAGAQLAVNTPEEPVTWSRYRLGDLQVLRLGTQQQPVLEKSGDNLRIDWGYLYVVAPPESGAASVATVRPVAIDAFTKSGGVPESDNLQLDQPYAQELPILADSIDFGAVTSAPVSHHLVIAYDDLYSIAYFQRRLRPYWRRNSMDIAELLRASLADYASLEQRSKAFDDQLMADLTKAGGENYARLCALAYRQTFAAHKLTADVDGTPLFFSKEISATDPLIPST